MSRLPVWVINKEDEIMFDKAVAYKAPNVILSSKGATKGFVEAKVSQVL